MVSGVVELLMLGDVAVRVEERADGVHDPGALRAAQRQGEGWGCQMELLQSFDDGLQGRAATVFASSRAVVTGPTPPGTGVSPPARP